MSLSDDKHDAEQRMLGAIPGEPALGRGPAPGDDYSRHEYDHPAAGWGAARSVARVLERAGEPLEGVRALFVMNHEDGGFDCPGCAWPDDPSRAPARHLRERRQARHVGASACEGRPRVLRPPHRQRAGRVERLRPRGGGTARRAAELQPCKRQVRADLLGGHVRARRRHAAGAAEPAPGLILHLRAAQQRGDLPLPALGARVRHEQPAGLLEHVPRGQRPGD